MNNIKMLNFFSSKRGMDIDLWFNVFELLIVFLVAGILWDTVNSEVRTATYEKLYFSRDNALLVNTIYASPGDIKYYYTEPTGDFIFDFKQNEVSVYEQHELIEGGVISYPFAEDKNYNFLYSTLQPEKSQNIKMTYSKNKNNIEAK